MTMFFENPANAGVGRKYRFHGAFGSKAAAERKESHTHGAFIRQTVIRGTPRYLVLSPKSVRNPTATRGRASQSSEGRTMAKRSRSSRRKRSARRHSRRRHAGVALSANPPRRRRRRSGARRNPFRAMRRRSGRRSRRNPPGIVSAIGNAFMDGALVSAGQLGQNLITRNIPDIVPATMSMAPQLNSAIKDVGLVVLGAFVAHKAIGGDRARMFVAGQASAAINRQLRAANIPTVSTALGEFDPVRGMGAYVRGVPRVAPVVNRALPPGRTTAPNVRTLKGIGVYVDGMSNAPSLF